MLHNSSASRIKDILMLALSEMIGKEISAQQMLHPVVDVMRELLQADRGTIYLLGEEGNELVSVAAHLPEMEEIRVPISQGIAGWVARTRKTVNIPYCESDSRFWKGIDRKTGYKTRSVLAGPLLDTTGSLIGVVQFLNKRDENFTDDDAKLLVTMAQQAAALLEETTLGKGPDYVDGEPRESRTNEVDGGETNFGFTDQFNRIIGVGEPMRAIFRTVRKVAPTEATVLLRGESGTGKGLIARALHFTSPHQEAPFVKVDCTALPEGLMENELFGHERGAYTGAHTRSAGKVEAADGGTLFLDEIGDLPARLQGKLLTLLQERTYCRVGGTEAFRANVRIIAATNRPLEQLVKAGDFREDLYYRLKVVQITLPPLRERGREDLVRLINHFVAVASRRHNRLVRKIDSKALETLLSYRWPGNIRELQNCLESAVIFSEGEITPALLPLPRPAERSPMDGDGTRLPSLCGTFFCDEPTARELEARYISWLLERYKGNRSACARVLHIGRNTLLRKMKAFGLDTEGPRPSSNVRRGPPIPSPRPPSDHGEYCPRGEPCQP